MVVVVNCDVISMLFFARPLKVSLKRPVGGASVSQTPSTSSAEEEQKKVPKLKLKFSAEDVRGQRSSHSSLESEEMER